jgi:hypothetical protein
VTATATRAELHRVGKRAKLALRRAIEDGDLRALDEIVFAAFVVAHLAAGEGGLVAKRVRVLGSLAKKGAP